MARGEDAGGPYVWVQQGNGGRRIRTWQDLWTACWAAIAYAIYFAAHGHCTCGCGIQGCHDCAYECRRT